jgi:hypothetical protein
MITSDTFVRRFSFSCEKYIIQVRTCPTKPVCDAYYGKVGLSQIGAPQIWKPEHEFIIPSNFCHENHTDAFLNFKFTTMNLIASPPLLG